MDQYHYYNPELKVPMPNRFDGENNIPINYSVQSISSVYDRVVHDGYTSTDNTKTNEYDNSCTSTAISDSNCDLQQLKVNVKKLEKKEIKKLRNGDESELSVEDCDIYFKKKRNKCGPRKVKIMKEKEPKIKKTLITSVECPYTSEFKYKIVQHELTHLKNQTYSCRDCSFTAKCLYLLKQHKKEHTEKEVITCKFCPFSTNNKTTYLKHKVKHVAPKERVIQCVECSFTADSRYVLKEHSRLHRRGTRESLQCYECSFIASCRSALNEHKQTHKNQLEIYRCEKCSFTTTNQIFLVSHETNEHPSNEHIEPSH